jgi:type VI protein secretion system component VasF
MKSNETEPSDNDRAQRLQAAFIRATTAIENSLVDAPTSSLGVPDDASSREDVTDIHALRAVVRRAASDYARRLRDEGVTPERMLVLVKATTDASKSGFAARELTNDIVRWSIEAYFAD